MAKINFAFNVSKARKRLDSFGILILDEKHAKFLSIKDDGVNEGDLVTTLPIYEDQAGYFKGSSGGGISDEQNVRKEFQKRFYKEALKSIEENFQNNTLNKLVIMCPEEDISLLNKLIKNDIGKSFAFFIAGNYVKIGKNDILKKVFETV
ncbi:hypothetical protein JW766_06600 [Candidatus Dojkabacteria bacterium]|nr:hypothetical protein [Candidatus Dojkabacteria bacterium]